MNFVEGGTVLYHIANDERERKSAEKLSVATKRLLQKEEPQKLTVSLLSEEAGVSRSTFYRLFDEPGDVLQFIADDSCRSLIESYIKVIERAEKHAIGVPNPIVFYEDAVRKNGSLIQGFFRVGQGDLLREGHKKALLELAPVLFPDLDPGSEELTLFVEMRAAVFHAYLTTWANTGFRVPYRELQRYALQQIEFFSKD